MERNHNSQHLFQQNINAGTHLNSIAYDNLSHAQPFRQVAQDQNVGQRVHALQFNKYCYRLNGNRSTLQQQERDILPETISLAQLQQSTLKFTLPSPSTSTASQSTNMSDISSYTTWRLKQDTQLSTI